MSSTTKNQPIHPGPDDSGDPPEMPLEVSQDVGAFDRFAKKAADLSSRAWFFTFCVLLVVIWAPSYFVLHDIDTWQLIINTCTTIVTFLLVALIQNSQTRAENALQHKLNAIAQGLGDLMEHMADVTPEPAKQLADDLDHDLAQLRAAVGIERYESSAQNRKDA
jgi:low affinity Fe/Cu permease